MKFESAKLIIKELSDKLDIFDLEPESKGKLLFHLLSLNREWTYKNLKCDFEADEEDDSNLTFTWRTWCSLIAESMNEEYGTRFDYIDFYCAPLSERELSILRAILTNRSFGDLYYYED